MHSFRVWQLIFEYAENKTTITMKKRKSRTLLQKKAKKSLRGIIEKTIMISSPGKNFF